MTFIGNRPSYNEPRVVKVRKVLQNKVGTGHVDPAVIEKMQEYLDTLEIDYTPIANKYIGHIEEIIADIPQQNYDREYYLSEIVKPVMDLKASGGMFNEQVISSISGSVLRLLENMHRLDDDMVDIIEAHNQSIRSAIALGVRSMEDHRAQKLIMEIKQACKRYHDKNMAKKL